MFEETYLRSGVKMVDFFGPEKHFPATNEDWERDEERMRARRSIFYRELSRYFSDGLVYYPGSGSDPVPFRVFGERVIYGSLREAEYLERLKGTEEHWGFYKQEIEETEGLSSLKGVYTDIFRSSFPDGCFRLILIFGLPIKFDQSVVAEFNRLLSVEGVIAIEEDTDLSELWENVQTLIEAGYTPHELDESGGVANVEYFAPTPFCEGQLDSISQEEFLKRRARELEVTVFGHVFRVFQKQISS